MKKVLEEYSDVLFALLCVTIGIMFMVAVVLNLIKFSQQSSYEIGSEKIYYAGVWVNEGVF